jgi:hypothetical protein
MMIEIENDSETVAKRISEVAERIEIVPEEPIEEPKVEEIESEPTE